MADARKRSDEVEDFLRALDHPLAASVRMLCDAFLSAEPSLEAHIKWNAPSFVFGGEDRVTFRLAPRQQCGLVFHRGVKVRKDSESFRFEDESGLVTWVTPDRGTVTLADAADAMAKRDALVQLVQRWIRA